MNNLVEKITKWIESEFSIDEQRDIAKTLYQFSKNVQSFIKVTENIYK